MGKAKKKGAAKKVDDDLDDLDAILAEQGVDLSKAKDEPKEEPKQELNALAPPPAAKGDTAVAKDAAAAFLASQGISVGDNEGDGGEANKKKKKKKKKGGGDDEAAAAAPKPEKVCHNGAMFF
jgi:hypothetical protein